MTLRTLALSLTLAMTAGHAAMAETVTFDPAAGAERTYRMEMSIRPGRSDEAASYRGRQLVSLLARLETGPRQGDDLTLRIMPLWMRSRVDGEVFSTSEGVPHEVQEVMETGFAAHVDLSTGAITDVTSPGGGDVPMPMLEAIGEQFGTTFAPVPIEAEEGWSTTLTSFVGSPDVTITVTDVTEDRVFLRYEGEDEMARLAGVAVLDRDEGWIDRVAITSDRRIANGDGTFDTLRETLAMAPHDFPHPIHADYSFEPPQWRDMPEAIVPIEPLPGEEQIFPHSKGQVVKEGSDLSLRFTHEGAPASNVGRFAIDEARLFEGEEALDVPLEASLLVTYRNWEEGDPLVTSGTLEAVTLRDVRYELAVATEIRADLSWFPTQPFTMTLSPDAEGRGEVTRNGAAARLMPTEDGFDLILSGQPTDRFSWSLPEGSGAKGKIYAADRGPQWLTPTESIARRIAVPNYGSIRVALRMDGVPEAITVRVDRHEDTPAATRPMRFLTEAGRRLDPESPPETRMLFEDGPPRALAAVTPEGLNVGALYFSLEALQAERCTAALDRPVTEGGHELVFAEDDTDGEHYDGTRRLQLQTPDGVRTHFYERGTRQVTLSCEATLSWEPADGQPDAERPWQIDPAALDISTDLTVAGLMDRIRFLDGAGEALMLAAPDGLPLSPDDGLERAIFSDGTLRVAGTPETILRAVRRPETTEHRFTVAFPDLPAPEEAPQ